MQVTEENFHKVAEILGYIGEFVSEINGITGYHAINFQDRVSTAQLGVDTLTQYMEELRALTDQDKK